MRAVPIAQEMGNLRKCGVDRRERGGHEGSEDDTFDLLLSVASNVMHSRRHQTGMPPHQN